MNAVLEKPRASKAPKAKAPAKSSPAAEEANAPSEEWSFMEGKALAALMVRETGRRPAAKDADLDASYRDPGQKQDNFTAPFLDLLLKEPRLVGGFSAALSSMLAEGMITEGCMPESTAKISYKGCTTHTPAEQYESTNVYTEAPLDEQLAKFALEDYGSHAVEEVPKQAGQVVDSVTTSSPEFHKISRDAIEHAGMKVQQAVHLLEIVEDDFCTAVVYGLTRIAKTLPQEVTELMGRSDMGDYLTGALSDLSNSLLEVTEVLITVNNGIEDTALHAVVSLLQFAKAIVDDATDEGMRLSHKARDAA